MRRPLDGPSARLRIVGHLDGDDLIRGQDLDPLIEYREMGITPK
jgi:hypothetical protein